MAVLPRVELLSAKRDGNIIHAIGEYEFFGLRFHTSYEFEIRDDGWYWTYYVVQHGAIMRSEKKNTKLSKETVEKIQELLKEVKENA